MAYKVLWIDDQPTDTLQDLAEDFDLDIHVETCYNNGIEWLRNNQEICMAVILDVKCKITDDPTEVASRNAFREKWLDVVELCTQRKQIPWFVYTAGDYEGIEALQVMIPSRQFYRKPIDMGDLIKNISQAIELSDMAMAVKKYGNVLNFCYNQPNHEDVVKLLFRIIKIVEDNDNNTSAFNDMRKVLGWTTSYMREHGMLRNDITNFNKASLYLNKVNFACKDNQVGVSKTLVPDYIKNCFMACQYVCNNGSHSKSEGASDEADNCLVVDEDVKNGVAPYLIRSTFFELLTIITWCKGLPTTQEGIDALRADIAKLDIPWTVKSEKTK